MTRGAQASAARRQGCKWAHLNRPRKWICGGREAGRRRLNGEQRAVGQRRHMSVADLCFGVWECWLSAPDLSAGCLWQLMECLWGVPVTGWHGGGVAWWRGGGAGGYGLE